MLYMEEFDFEKMEGNENNQNNSDNEFENNFSNTESLKSSAFYTENFNKPEKKKFQKVT